MLVLMLCPVCGCPYQLYVVFPPGRGSGSPAGSRCVSPALRGGHLDFVTQQIRMLLYSLHR